MNRRRCGAGLAAGTLLLAGGCAGIVGGEPLRINLVGIEPLPGEGLEVRMALKLRLQNPNDAALEFDGIALELDVRGMAFASGVSSERGSIGRFGESVVSVPVSVSTLAVLRQALDLAQGTNGRVDYELRGRLAGTGLGGLRFSTRGEIELPRGLGRR